MAPQKSPAFQFYPKDFLTGTATMSLQEVGAYMRLLCYAWDAGSVPNDPKERSRICACSRAQERELWKKVGIKFSLQNDVFLNERMEEERKKQADYRRRQSDKGKASAAVRLQPNANHGSTTVESRLQPEVNSSSSSSSSSSVTTLKNNVVEPPLRPLISGEASPKGWGKIHGEHVAGFCDWVCLPEFVFAEFVRKSAGADYVREWAKGIRAKCEGQTVGDNLKFWRVRWSETHPETATTAKTKVVPSVDQLLANEAAERAGRAS